MNAIISQSGEKDPTLPARIAKLEGEITQALKELNEAGEQDTQAQLRILELEARLTQFRTDFETLQQEVATAAP